jgi:hypothetical protein
MRLIVAVAKAIAAVFMGMLAIWLVYCWMVYSTDKGGFALYITPFIGAVVVFLSILFYRQGER